MRVAKGSTNIPLYLQLLLDGKILTLVQHQALYSLQTGQTLAYTLEYKEAGSSTVSTLSYDAAKSTANSIYFLLPTAMFTGTKQYHCALKFQYNTTIDYALDDFDITVYDPLS